ncbi:proto-oncogene vav-like isoform X2 [Brienomyrus brachyistius]|uniref:proto-oncogene vav-like isoform X2 n=1 Tax=Brienomyrus brachyistius TaxID=42636 RepID=UPI0020B414C2|nr:proto-oncogene vav-like isoform X2 [Brienomyrus brachyistius]
MDLWRQCTSWLVRCQVLPSTHRLVWDSAQVCDLAYALRDGVLLCQLLNNLKPQCISQREIVLRPQMSQFFCLKNIRTFLGACEVHFGMRSSELFEAFDLFDLRNFEKVIDSLSNLSHTTTARHREIEPFPVEPCLPDEDIYSGLSEEIDCMEDGGDDLYDCVEDESDEGEDIYEDLMRSEEPPEWEQKTKEVDKRSCCLQEIAQTEEKYSNTLESIIQHFMRPLQQLLQPQDIEAIFINVENLAETHRGLLKETHHSIFMCGASNLHQVFISYKNRLLLYGRYCSQVEEATKHLDQLSSTYTDVQTVLKDCSQRANNGRFTLRDLLMVPMQRVLKYHLLLQELLKHTVAQAEKENLRSALDAMRDLAQCVNEVKRDNEIIRQITSFQLSIENMRQSLAHYGRPRIDGELKICTPEKKSKQDRYIFLFDMAMVVCKRKSGDVMGLKEIVELEHYRLSDEIEEKDKKWSHLFILVDSYGHRNFELYCKTKELKRKWLEQFSIAFSNVFPEGRKANNHEFEMHSFGETVSCAACHMLLRGIFYQGYRCTVCSTSAHKECLDRVPVCKKKSEHSGTMRKREPKRPALEAEKEMPRMEVFQEYCGRPPPPGGAYQALHLSVGDVIELLTANGMQQWWEGRNLVTSETGWFPCSNVGPFTPKPEKDLEAFPWFAGTIDRHVAKSLLISRPEGTYLVRQKEYNDFAISIKIKTDVKHIKITYINGMLHINEKKAFKGLIELVEYYQQNTLKECFKELDTTLQISYKGPEQTMAQSTWSEDAHHSQFAQSDTSASSPLSWARVLYDFSARDSSELSLRMGDDVKIISKDTPEGWWMGESYGQTGLFPANYVQENYSEYC